MEKQSEDIDKRLTYINRCFHMWKEAYTLCKYEAQSLQETIVVVHYHVCKDWSSQKMQ